VAVAKDVLERNNLAGYGAPAKDPRGGFGASVTVQTEVNTLPEARFAAMSDADLEAYDRLLRELRELLPKDEPKRIGGVSR
jgi:hypothetical protein